MSIKLKGIVAEDFANYKVPCMFLSTCFCDFKCCIEGGFPISYCQNNELESIEYKTFENETIIKFYLENPVSKSIVFGGMEPMLQYNEMFELIRDFRKVCDDDIVIYTGYYKDEIFDKVNNLKQFKNIIIKFGRYIPNRNSRFDEVLGLNLVSENQYAERIS